MLGEIKLTEDKEKLEISVGGVSINDDSCIQLSGAVQLQVKPHMKKGKLYFVIRERIYYDDWNKVPDFEMFNINPEEKFGYRLSAEQTEDIGPIRLGEKSFYYKVTLISQSRPIGRDAFRWVLDNFFPRSEKQLIFRHAGVGLEHDLICEIADVIHFGVAPSIVPRERLHSYLDRKLWELIADHSIPMEDTSFSRQAVEDRIMEWQNQRERLWRRNNSAVKPPHGF